MKNIPSLSLIKVKDGISSIVSNVLVAFLSITCIFPMVWLLYSSLKTERNFANDILGVPTEFRFENYPQAFTEGRIGSYMMNSLFVTVITVIISIILSFAIGYCLSRFKFPGRTFLYYLFLSGMLVPIYALLVPIFIEFKVFGILNKRITLILPYIAFALPVSIFLIESYVKGIPIELEEAAFVDGSSQVFTMFVIIMPVCSPILATCAILSFLNTWNEFPLALVLISSTRLKTIPIGLTNFVGTYSTNYTLMMAALVIATLPVITIYLLFYNNIMRGMVAGAVKG
ncbi:MAG: carbohydrate ABC transporter permease [Treponema sp.]|jgi:raffinose/stachyose/melibiose transport system permease protein|nr:carbohydrate ABC transporter permease [Treponema sp.]